MVYPDSVPSSHKEKHPDPKSDLEVDPDQMHYVVSER